MPPTAAGIVYVEYKEGIPPGRVCPGKLRSSNRVRIDVDKIGVGSIEIDIYSLK